MCDVFSTRQRSLCIAVIVTCVALVVDVRAQGQNQTQGNGQQSSSTDQNQQSRDQQPQTVQEHLATLKRQQSRETSSGERAPIRDADHTTRIRVRNYVELKRQNVVMQRRDYSCGAASLATICQYYWGDDVSEDMFLEALDEILTAEEVEDRIENGLAMSDLRRAAVKLGYQSVVGKTTFSKLTEVKVPVIVGIQPGGHKHFVVYRGVDAEWVYMADSIRGNIRMPIWEFREQWQENAVLVVHKPGHKVKQISKLSLREEETQLGEVNNHLIRTQQARQPRIKQTLR